MFIAVVFLIILWTLIVGYIIIAIGLFLDIVVYTSITQCIDLHALAN